MIGKATCFDPKAWEKVEHAPSLLNLLGNYIANAAAANYKKPVPGWNIGSEHPAQAATLMLLLEKRREIGLSCKKVIEVGYQAGGTAIPLSLYCRLYGIEFTAIDNYESPESGRLQDELIRGFLEPETKLIGGQDFTPASWRGAAFDLIILDHNKQLMLQHIMECITENVIAPDGWFAICDVSVCKESSWDPVALANAHGSLGVLSNLKDGAHGIICFNLGLLERTLGGDSPRLQEDPGAGVEEEPWAGS